MQYTAINGWDMNLCPKCRQEIEVGGTCWDCFEPESKMITEMPARFSTMPIEQITAVVERLELAAQNERCSNVDQVGAWLTEANLALYIANGGSLFVECPTCSGSGYEATTARISRRGRADRFVETGATCTRCKGDKIVYFTEAY